MSEVIPCIDEVEPCIDEASFGAFEHASQSDSDSECGRGGGGNNVADDEAADWDEPSGGDD